MLDPSQRQHMLAAMGIEVYSLRALAGQAEAQPPQHDFAAADGMHGLVVACGAGASRDAAGTRLRAVLPLSLGLGAAAVCWIEADVRGTLPEPPPARAYLALGADMPRALGANLSTQRQRDALIAAAAAPGASLRDAASKRALWQALKPLARGLRDALN